MRKFLLVIPARFKSSRFPGKPLVKINGIAMIKRTYLQCLKATNKDNIIVATDNDKIKNFCNKNNINVIMTSKKCLTGTDRIVEVAKKIYAKFYINVQGDEPIFNPNDIKLLIKNLKKFPNKVLNGYCKIRIKKKFVSTNIPKVVLGYNKELMYMSRSPIPYKSFIKKNSEYPLRQICAYCFPRNLLMKYKSNKKQIVESLEDIEILRFKELGIPIKMIKMSESSVSVDVPSDIKEVEKILNKKK